MAHELSSQAISSSHPLRVLVADTDDDTRALYRQLFRDIGCDVIEATDGRDALAKALVRQPAAVVSELRLPFMDGVALCEILRRDQMTAAVPIVIVTGEARPTQIDRARSAGADVVLVKPIPPDALLREIDRLTQHRQAGALQRVQPAPQRSEGTRRLAKAKAHARYATTTPPATPPSLTCPTCDLPLEYQLSHVGGVNDQHAEQWDYFMCCRCGAFQYRQRTRKVQRLSDNEQEWVMRLNA